MKMYHGTDSTSAKNILQDVNLSIGKGELGKGFYVGNLLHKAYCWAYHKARKNGNWKDKKVIEFEFKENEIANLCPLFLDPKEARKNWRKRTIVYNQQKGRKNIDYVVCDVLGGHYNHFYQYKFEDNVNHPNMSKSFLNKSTKNLLP